MFWNYFNNRFAKLVQKGTVDEVFQLLDSDYDFSEKMQKALILRKNRDEIRGYFIRKRTLSDANQVLLIEQLPAETFDMIDHQSVCDKAAEMIVQQGNSDCIRLLLYNQKVSEKLQNMIVKRNISDEIKALLSRQSISAEIANVIVERGVEDEIEILLTKNITVSKELEQSLVARGKAAEQTLAVKSGLQRQESVSQIIDCGHHEAIMALLQAIKCDSPVHLSPEDRDKIIFRGNLEEIKAFIVNDFLATEKGIVHLIDLELYSCAAKFINLDCSGYSPITEKVVAAVLEKGDELLVLALLRHTGQLPHLLKHWNKQEWFEKQILARGSKDEISSLARIYKVSDYTVDEILRRNVGQEIKALIDGKNISDAHIYKLIDLQRYDLLENYARCVPNNPTFYLLTKYMKAHR